MRRGCAAALLCAALAGFAATSPALAQGQEAADIATCLCLTRSIDALGAGLAAHQRSYGSVQEELNRFDAQLQAARANMDVNNPAAVAQFRELLARRDAAFQRSTGLATTDINRTTELYNARVGDYNARCANRPRDPFLVERVQQTLACPPGY